MSRLSKKNLNIEMQLLFAEFLQNTHLSSHYSLTLVNHLTQFQTTLYPILDCKIDFSTLRPFLVQNLPEHQNSKNMPALLKIIFNPLGSESKLESIVEQKSVIPFYQHLNASKQKKSRRNSKCLLVFPILYRGRTVVGQINIKFSFSQVDQLSQANSSRAFASTISKLSIAKQPKKVFSSSNCRFFNPCVSRGIPVGATEEVEVQEEQEKIKSFQNKNSLHHNLQCENQLPVQPNQQNQIDQQNPRNQQNQIEVGEQKLQNIEEKQEKVIQSNISQDMQLPLSNNIVIQAEQIQQSERFQEIPEDYRHLFQKICEINKKYAPLQRIPSQQELSEQVSLIHKSPNESFHSLNSEFSQTSSNPLAVAQQLLKELNLYKFGQLLQAQSQKQKQHQ